MGYSDPQGKLRIPANYTRAGGFDEGFAT